MLGSDDAETSLEISAPPKYPNKVQDVEINMDITIKLFFDKSHPDKTLVFSRLAVTTKVSLGCPLTRSITSLYQIPLLDYLSNKNPIMRIEPPIFRLANNFRLGNLHRHCREGNRNGDFLSTFLQVKENNSKPVDDSTIVLWLLSNVIAGSDSTASTMCAAIYYVLKTPDACTRLLNELRTANLSFPAQWKEIQGLEYLDTVMRESMRINPGVGPMLERIAPKDGPTLPDGRFVLRDYCGHFSKMKNTDFTFGAGSRACLGRYISQLESFKMIVTLFDTFDVRHN
ncbi:hypothetical protein E8E15_002400 [Penicillium rubens]|nr:hypothetical protein E8E15_002400 [Penicillium rubens]